MITATVTEVKFGEYLSLEGLMTEDGEYYVGVPQLSDCFQFDKNQASRTVKSLYSNDFQFDKLKTPLNPKGINAIPLEIFGNLIAELAFKGNQKAQMMTRILVIAFLGRIFIFRCYLRNFLMTVYFTLKVRLSGCPMFPHPIAVHLLF